MVPLELIQNIFRVRWNANWITPNSHAAATAVDLAPSRSITRHDAPDGSTAMRPLEELSQEVVRRFAAPCELRAMLKMSAQMRHAFYEKLESSPACMLPSFCHTLPTGTEAGTVVALDVGGSTFRAALVQLNTRAGPDEPVRIKRMTASKIDEKIRKMPAAAFFDWMAAQIKAMVDADPDIVADRARALPLGLAWSFPLEQTSQRGARIQSMGKGFACHQGALGQDLGDTIEAACRRAGFQVRVEAVINDSSATLLSQAYRNPATSLGLIMGTGTNAAAFLPVACLGPSKFGARDPAWFRQAERVITNTELSMFGKGVLPETRWDERLNHDHQLPDFQPLEYMTTGRYLGEILRLIIAEAVATCALFGGVMPPALREPYSLDTALLAVIEADTSTHLRQSAPEVQTACELDVSPSEFDMAFLRVVVEAISHRAAVYLAVAIHALWSLQKETDINLTTPAGTPKTVIACNGSVILKYPGFKDRVEGYLKRLVSLGSGAGIFPVEQIVLEPTYEAAIVGAAVAVAMADG